MATIGALLLGSSLSFVTFAYAGDIRPTVAESLGYSGVNADTTARLIKWDRDYRQFYTIETDSLRRRTLVKSGLDSATADSLIQYHAPDLDVQRALLKGYGQQLDFTAQKRTELRRTVFLGLSIVPVLVALWLASSWWWQWFGARRA